MNGITHTSNNGLITLSELATRGELPNYCQYVYINGVSYKASNYTITLPNNFVTTPDLQSYVTNSSLSSTLSSYVTNSSLSSTLSSYVTSGSLSTTLSSYVKTADLPVKKSA